MEKNITVVDEQGNRYGATYPRRAKGLVKKGRARFVDETTICLACPPNEYLEETMMEENKDIKTEVEESIEESASEHTVDERELTLGYLLEQMELLRDKLDYLNDILQQVHGVSEAQAQVFRDAIMARETTYQRMIAFYERAYEDCMPGNKKREFILKAIKNLPPMATGGPVPDYAAIISVLNTFSFD